MRSLPQPPIKANESFVTLSLFEERERDGDIEGEKEREIRRGRER